jgi:hypothetical protein
MKIFFIILLGIALALPLYSQETELDISGEYDIAAAEDNEETLGSDKSGKKEIDFSRKYFEIGFDIGAGFDNGLVEMNDVFKKKIVIDMSKVANSVSNDGAGMNFSISPGFFLNVKNITIDKGIYDFGLLFNVDGGVNMNISKSLFTLISEGNINRHNSSGSISAFGGIFSEIGLRGSAKYEVDGRTLTVGVRPSIYTPVIYIPSNSKITYSLSTTKEGNEGIFVNTKGNINVYTPTSLENVEPGNFIIGPSGFDLSLEGEYALFPFLDVGGSLSKIPFGAATLTNQMNISMKEFNINLPGEDLIAGKDTEIPEIDFNQTYNNSVQKKVYRLFRFDIYARYKPFETELVVLRPNIGFSANVNEGDEKGYFNIGLEAMFNPHNLFRFYIGTGYLESIWKHKAGINLNLRAFELDLEAALRDQDFAGAFLGRGINFNLGLRFGW